MRSRPSHTGHAPSPSMCNVRQPPFTGGLVRRFDARRATANLDPTRRVLIVSLATAAGTLPLWRVLCAIPKEWCVVRDSDHQASMTISSSPVASCAHVPRVTCPQYLRTESGTWAHDHLHAYEPLQRPLMCLTQFCPRACPGVPRPDHVASLPPHARMEPCPTRQS